MPRTSLGGPRLQATLARRGACQREANVLIKVGATLAWYLFAHEAELRKHEQSSLPSTSVVQHCLEQQFAGLGQVTPFSSHQDSGTRLKTGCGEVR